LLDVELSVAEPLNSELDMVFVNVDEAFGSEVGLVVMEEESKCKE
jgi:hypothetical protein